MVKFYLQELQMCLKKNKGNFLFQSKEHETWHLYRMKVILLENVKRIGSIGEVIDVKRGFARNFLIANKKALYASKENIKQVEKIKLDLSKKDNEKKHEAKKIQEKVKKSTKTTKKATKTTETTKSKTNKNGKNH